MSLKFGCLLDAVGKQLSTRACMHGRLVLVCDVRVTDVRW